jgi:hypothetical protein
MAGLCTSRQYRRTTSSGSSGFFQPAVTRPNQARFSISAKSLTVSPTAKRGSTLALASDCPHPLNFSEAWVEARPTPLKPD